MHSSLVLKTTQASFSPSLFSSNVFQKDCLSSLLTRCVLLLLWMPTSVNGPFIQVFQPSFFFNDTPKGWHGIIQYNVLQRCNILPWEVNNLMGHCSPWLYGGKKGRDLSLQQLSLRIFTIPSLTQGTVLKNWKKGFVLRLVLFQNYNMQINCTEEMLNAATTSKWIAWALASNWTVAPKL